MSHLTEVYSAMSSNLDNERIAVGIQKSLTEVQFDECVTYSGIMIALCKKDTLEQCHWQAFNNSIVYAVDTYITEIPLWSFFLTKHISELYTKFSS